MTPTNREPIASSNKSGKGFHSVATSLWYQCRALLFVVAISSVGCQPFSLPQAETVQPPAVAAHPVPKQSNDAQQSLITVSISPEARVKATAVDKPMELQQDKWQVFSIAIDNAAQITAPLTVESDQIMTSPDDSSRDRWFQLEIEPKGQLTGSSREIRKLHWKSRDAGVRTAILNFNAGQGTQDLGFRSDVLLTFKIRE